MGIYYGADCVTLDPCKKSIQKAAKKMGMDPKGYDIEYAVSLTK